MWHAVVWGRRGARAEVSLGSRADGPYADVRCCYAWLRDCLVDLLHVRFGLSADARMLSSGPALATRAGVSRLGYAPWPPGPLGRLPLLRVAALGHVVFLSCAVRPGCCYHYG